MIRLKVGSCKINSGMVAKSHDTIKLPPLKGMAWQNLLLIGGAFWKGSPWRFPGPPVAQKMVLSPYTGIDFNFFFFSF